MEIRTKCFPSVSSTSTTIPWPGLLVMKYVTLSPEDSSSVRGCGSGPEGDRELGTKGLTLENGTKRPQSFAHENKASWRWDPSLSPFPLSAPWWWRGAKQKQCRLQCNFKLLRGRVLGKYPEQNVQNSAESSFRDAQTDISQGKQEHVLPHL